MSNITLIQDKDGLDYVIIDHGNEEYTSMLKSTYDEQQAAMIADE
jgi:flavorubredoxin